MHSVSYTQLYGAYNAHLLHRFLSIALRISYPPHPEPRMTSLCLPRAGEAKKVRFGTAAALETTVAVACCWIESMLRPMRCNEKHEIGGDQAG